MQQKNNYCKNIIILNNVDGKGRPEPSKFKNDKPLNIIKQNIINIIHFLVFVSSFSCPDIYNFLIIYLLNILINYLEKNMRDKKGRFAKDDDGYSITFKIPSLKKLFYWSIIFFLHKKELDILEEKKGQDC